MFALGFLKTLAKAVKIGLLTIVSIVSALFVFTIGYLYYKPIDVTTVYKSYFEKSVGIKISRLFVTLNKRNFQLHWYGVKLQKNTPVILNGWKSTKIEANTLSFITKLSDLAKLNFIPYHLTIEQPDLEFVGVKRSQNRNLKVNYIDLDKIVAALTKVKIRNGCLLFKYQNHKKQTLEYKIKQLFIKSTAASNQK